MAKTLNKSEIEALRAIDTPTICNLLEMVAPDRRGVGYTTRQLNCVFPELKPMCGYARTALVRAKEPGPLPPDKYLKLRLKYVDYVGSGPSPKVSVVQDLDDPPGYGSFWGEVNSNVHKALGCQGTVTNGSVRDLDMIAEDFQLLSGVIAPSHAFIHLVDFDCPVNIHGMLVHSGDLVHADRHGAVVIPHDVARDVPKALDLMQRREAVVIGAARDSKFSVAKLKKAYADSAKIKK
ncbi:MAG: RraA family protein [Rhodospirillaceae bacterium]|jgi:regulator of RNase E activity RraA|nr:RraA family protein [Rhodospirillaceae bacterium]MBT6119024.1 RraA family protein [Rhodospirillaceae bacterium]